MTRFHLSLVIRAGLLLGCVVGLATCVSSAATPGPAGSVTERSPWSQPAVASDAVPTIYHTVWRAAGNRTRCALLAPKQLGPTLAPRATARAATFSGGWAVAYDLPDERSAFGVAGADVDAWSPQVYDDWPEKRTYGDGSRVGYGREGGTGPNWLAYVRIPGQQCLYNVWSRRGQAHLEELLDQLRFVTVDR